MRMSYRAEGAGAFAFVSWSFWSKGGGSARFFSCREQVGEPF